MAKDVGAEITLEPTAADSPGANVECDPRTTPLATALTALPPMLRYPNDVKTISHICFPRSRTSQMAVSLQLQL